MNETPEAADPPPRLNPVDERPPPPLGVWRRAVKIHEIMAVVCWCALVCGLGRMATIDWLSGVLAVALGPICVAIALRCMGRRGMLGGVVGGIVTDIGVGVMLYAWEFFHPRPNYVDYTGPGMTLFILAVYGAVLGLAGGMLMRAAALLTGSRSRS
jgi:hypothetical protein